jgi:uncharacterized protein YcbX
VGEQVVGHVVGLWRYPVKSMAAEPLEAVELSWHGLAGDRRWAFVRPGEQGNGFPWLTIRQRNDLTGYVPAYPDPEQPAESATVRTPSGAVLDVLDPALARELGDGVQVLTQLRGVFDESPLSLLTTTAVAALGRSLGRELAPVRFRPNLLVRPVDGTEYAEDGWVGSVLSVGTAALRVDQPDPRCVVVNVDPATGERDPEVLRVLARERGARLGVYGSTVRPGLVRVGDEVRRTG